jgi:hypothetical protein
MPPVGSLGIDGTGAAFGRRLQFGPNACRAPEGCAPRPGCVGRTAECPKSPSVPGWAGWAGWPGWQRAVTSGHPEREAVSAAIRRVEADAASRDAGRIEARRIRRTGPRVCCQGPACEAVVDVRPRAATPRCDPALRPRAATRASRPRGVEKPARDAHDSRSQPSDDDETRRFCPFFGGRFAGWRMRTTFRVEKERFRRRVGRSTGNREDRSILSEGQGFTQLVASHGNAGFSHGLAA